MGLIEYPKEKIADVNQASFQSFFIMKMPLACVSNDDSARTKISPRSRRDLQDLGEICIVTEISPRSRRDKRDLAEI